MIKLKMTAGRVRMIKHFSGERRIAPYATNVKTVSKGSIAIHQYILCRVRHQITRQNNIIRIVTVDNMAVYMYPRSVRCFTMFSFSSM